MKSRQHVLMETSILRPSARAAGCENAYYAMGGRGGPPHRPELLITPLTAPGWAGAAAAAAAAACAGAGATGRGPAATARPAAARAFLASLASCESGAVVQELLAHIDIKALILLVDGPSKRISHLKSSSVYIQHIPITHQVRASTTIT